MNHRVLIIWFKNGNTQCYPLSGSSETQDARIVKLMTGPVRSSGGVLSAMVTEFVSSLSLEFFGIDKPTPEEVSAGIARARAE